LLLLQRLDDSRVVDPETGEIFLEKNVVYRQGEIVKVLKPGNTGRTPKFIKQMTSRDQKRILSKLTTEERAFLYSIQFYLQWDTNVIADEDNNPLTWAQIEKIADISKPTRYKLVAALESKNAIRYVIDPRGKKIGIMMNPAYAYNGKKPSAGLRKLFKATKDIDAD
jgi:hypothetical protein